MKIMMLTQFYPPLIGGEERFTYNLSRLLIERGHQVSVITIQQAGLEAYEENEGVRIHRINGFTQQIPFLYSDTSRRAATPFPDPGLSLSIRKIIKQEKPQILHAHNWLVHSVVPLKYWSNVPLILTLHDYGLVCATKKLLLDNKVCDGPAWGKCLSCSSAHYGALKGSVTMTSNRVMLGFERRAVDMFVPVSNAVAEGNQLAENHMPYRVIPNFVPDTIGNVPPVESSFLEQLPDEPFLLFVGAFGHYKGVDFLLNTYKELNDPPPLVLIGYETSESPVQTQSLPDNVVVLRNVPHDAVMAAWQRSMIGFAPSLWNEPCATVPMEAMAMGKPVIATRIGGLTDIVSDGETGILVEPHNTQQLHDAMVLLIADADLRRRMGEAGMERVKLFQESHVVPQYEALYQELSEKSVRQ